ncbi:DEAD/DEAH box helicase family protein [Streptomyces mangrovi]|uniref:DEAD/DEAH box helicase family protein n=1 Tax=Streptomyces mangrovi TaxID=1206892 RepID=UPI00399C5260
MRRLGFRGGRVLEPGSGSGNFIGFAPLLTRDPVQMTGVEVEPTTAAIARHLYPDAEIITSGLEDVPLADGGFDGVVGNVPFGRYKRYDKVHNPDLKLSIHDHFVLKSLYATRPGGIVALITSRYTLDSESPEARERMYRLGDLVGAVRLPARAHAAAAGTDVVTDVLFLRRRMDGEEPGDNAWLTSRKRVLPGHDAELAVNAYFDDHPEYVLGELRAGSREWGPEVTVVGRTDQTPAEALAAVAAAISVEARAAGLTAADDQRTEPVQPVATGGTEGALGLDAEGNPTVIDGGRPAPLEIHPDQREQLIKLIRLKGLTLALYEAEADTPEPGETPELARLRAELRVAWRDYRKSHPPLTKPRQHYKFTPPEAREQARAQGLKDVPEAWKQRTAFAWIDDDPDASLLFGLEEWDERTGEGVEQKVLLTRVLEPRTLPARANSHEDAIALAMEYDGGRLDMARVAGLLDTDEESAAAQCADAGLAYRDPEQDDAWEPSYRYLSGNVRTKLAAARARAAEDPAFLGNVAALERVQPDDLAPSEIKAKIGAPWIPVDVYNDFLRHLGFEDAGVLHAGGTVWEVRGARNGGLARSEWGTGARPTQDLFTALLQQTESTLQVTYRDQEGRTYVDRDATDEAREKAKLIAEAFEDWVWDDQVRATRLAGIYNEQFNNLVMPEYSGSALTLPGLITDWEMRPHQNAAIRRIVNEPTALLAHVVGAGKTATMAAGAMELRRTGLARKPCIIVPNHMLKQWSREFRQLYPNARILAITASDLNKKRRAKFMGRIAGGEWDAVILTHEAFNRVPLRPESMRSYLGREMKSLREQLDNAASSGMHRNTVKQIEESLANAEARLEQQIESMGDDNGVFLEDTGIDYVFLDEAHEYKNLRTVSAIPGAGIQGSAKATKLHMVLSWLRETNESQRVATLATGTPIANSVTEAYVLKRYLAPRLLEEMGLDAFDNWAATFGEVVSQLEPDPKGDGYKYKARFSRFFNVPELMAAYRTFADVRMAEDLDLPTPPVRENEEGQRGETVLIPPTPAQRQFIKELPHKPWVHKPGGVLKALGEGLRASIDLDLVDAGEALRNLGVTPGRTTGTDMRSVGGKEMGSKIPYAADKIAEIWQETKDIVYPVSADDPTPQELPGGLQLVFLDEGTPGSTARHAADLYADLRDELVARGMPRESIRFIHEAGTDRKKEKLFADCRAGRVRVLIGSTQKMGTGTNIQDRAVALHHLSYPWRPADMAQRDGRIERRGNLNAPWVGNTPDDVRILYYITERTFDEFRLTTLARKARFIGQIQRRDFSAREIEDIGADAINLGMLSALASGDPAILQLAEATAERARLQGLARSWDRRQDNRTQQIADIDDFLTRADTALEGMRAAAPNRRPTTGDHFAMTVGDATYRSREAAANALGGRMAAIAADQSVRPGECVPIGTFGGQDFHAEIAYGASGRRQLRLRFAWGHVVPMGQREDRAQWQASSVTEANGRGAIQSLEHFLNHLDDDLDKLEKSAASLRAHREEIAANLRPKDENPYRIQARSKEREERALGKLVVANEKEAALAERAASVNEDAAEEVNEELTALREHIASLRKAIEDEHHVQRQAQALVRGDADPESAPAVAHQEVEPAEAAPGGEQPAAAPSAAGAEPNDGTAPAEPQDQPDFGQLSLDAEPAQAGTEPTAPETETEPSPEPEEQEAPGDVAPAAEAEDSTVASQGADSSTEPAPEGDQPFNDTTVEPGDRAPVTHIDGSRPGADPAAGPAAGEPDAPAPGQPQPEQHAGSVPGPRAPEEAAEATQETTAEQAAPTAESASKTDRQSGAQPSLFETAADAPSGSDGEAESTPEADEAQPVPPPAAAEPDSPAGTGAPEGETENAADPAQPATADDEQLQLDGPADAVAPAPDPADTEAAAEEPAADTEPVDVPTADAAAQDDAPAPGPEEPEPTIIDRGEMDTPPSTTDTDDAVPVEDPPEPQPYTDITPLAADPGYQLHLTGLDGQGPSAGELRHGDTTIAAVRLSASGHWLAHLEVDGMPADVTALNSSPQEAAHEGAILFSALTGTPYGAPLPAAEDGMISRADRLRADLRDAAQEHLDRITAAASRVRVDYAGIPQYQELSARLTEMTAAVTAGHSSRQMAANLTAVQQAVTAWGGALPTDVTLDERRHLAWPLAHLLYDTTRLHGRLQATLEAAQAERAALREQQATAAPAPDDSVQQTPPSPERGRGPVTTPDPERKAAPTPTEPPAPRPEAPEDPEMATPARPATPESQEAPAPVPADTGATSAQSDGQPARAEDMEGAAPASPGELPLWTGPAHVSVQEGDRPVDVVADFTEVQRAWDEMVPADKGTGEDLFAAVQADLLKLRQMLADATAETPQTAAPQPASVEPAAAQSSGEQDGTQRDRAPQGEAGAVNTALRQADAHAPALQDLPEWQRIQTVRGAFGNLVRVIKERAGEHFDKLMNDGGVADFLRRVSIRVCEKVAGWAQAGADRLRRGDERGTERHRDLPSAEALLRLGDAALEYSGPRRGSGSSSTSPPPADRASGAVDVPSMRKMGEALNRPLPGAAKRVSTAAARGRSTTAKGKTKKPAGGAEQAGHLRRGGTEQQARKPSQR